MAASVKGIRHTLTGSRVTLTTALGLTDAIFISDGTIRAGAANAGSVFIGDSSVAGIATAGVFLAANESFSLSLNGKSISTNMLNLIGTAADTVNIIVFS